MSETRPQGDDLVAEKGAQMDVIFRILNHQHGQAPSSQGRHRP